MKYALRGARRSAISLLLTAAILGSLLPIMPVVAAPPGSVGLSADASSVRSDETTQVNVFLKAEPLADTYARHRSEPVSGQRRALATQRQRIDSDRSEVLRFLKRCEPDLAAPVYAYRVVASGFPAKVRLSTLEKLRRHPLVKAVEPNPEARPHLVKSVPSVGADTLWQRGLDGSGSVVAIIDSGIDYNHPDLGGGWGNKVIGGWDFVENDADPMDAYGHGTQVAGCVAADGVMKGVAPKAKLLAYRIWDAAGNSGGAMLAALDLATDPDGDLTTSDDRPDVVHMSGGVWMGQHMTAEMYSVAPKAFGLGVLCTFSSGNNGTYYGVAVPGANPLALTVGAIGGPNSTSPDVLEGYSSKGSIFGSWEIKPEIVAPGRVTSTKVGGGYAANTGTSFAAPMVAGAAALLRQAHPDWGPREIKSAIVGSARELSMGTAMTTGGGALAVQQAADQTLLVWPPTVSFGYADQLQPTFAATRTVEVSNVGSATQTLSIWCDGTIPTGVTLSASPSVLTLHPGETSTVDITVAVDNEVCPDTSDPSEFYSFRLRVAGQGSAVDAPLALGKAGGTGPIPTVAGPTHAQPGTLKFWMYAEKKRQLNDATWEVSWGDGTTQSLAVGTGTWWNYTHSYLAPGQYQVRSRCRTLFGRWSSWSAPNVVDVVSPWDGDRAPSLVATPTGPPVLMTGSAGYFSAAANDPEFAAGGFMEFDWGDSTVTTVSVGGNWHRRFGASHSWVASGTYSVRIRAVDSAGLASEWFEAPPVWVHKPAPPAPPTGPTVVPHGQTWTGSITNTLDEAARIEIWYPGAGEERVLTQTLLPGESVPLSHVFGGVGLNSVWVRSYCTHSFASDWDMSFQVASVLPPTKPVVTLPPWVDVYQMVTASIATTDTDNNLWCYTVDWGDGQITRKGWTDTHWHYYAAPGIYGVKAMADDLAYGVSEWSDEVFVRVGLPQVPMGLAAATDDGSVRLSWTTSADQTVASYNVYRDGLKLNDTTLETTSFTDATAIVGTTYAYHVTAVDRLGFESAPSDAVNTCLPDVTPPLTPSGVSAASSASGVALVWSANAEPDLAGYNVYRSGTSGSDYMRLNSAPLDSPSFIDLSAPFDTLHHYVVTAVDGAGNESAPSTEVTGARDITPPTAPTALLGAAAGATRANLTWIASTDAVMVTGYRVERAASWKGPWSEAAISSGPAWTVMGLAANTRYYFRVQAVDLAGNVSGYSNVVQVRTLATDPPAPDTTAPTDPVDLEAAAVSSSEIALTWTASTDNVGVVGYRIEHCIDGYPFVEIATSSSASITISGFAASTRHHFRVRAMDAAGNPSGYSAIVDATTPQAPPSPYRYEDWAGNLVLSGGWMTMSNASYSNGTIITSGNTGASVTLSFTGTQVTWIGAKAVNYGQARIYLDGALASTVDCYAKNPAYQSVLFASPALSAGAHIIRIEVAGTKNKFSKGYLVPIDAFDVMP